MVEFRCLLARRRRASEITRVFEAAACTAFEADIRSGALHVHVVEDQHLLAAVELVDRYRRYALRTLDAIHLAVAVKHRIRQLATADRVMAEAGKAMGLEIARFD
jgi:hypothetical protein